MRRRHLFCIAIFFSLPLSMTQVAQSQSLGDIARQERTAKTEAEQASKNEPDKYLDNIQSLLRNEKFAEIEKIAATERSSKARFPGGGWKLRTLYLALSEFPKDFKPSNLDWTARIDALKRWIEKNPASITPRVALADAYLSYAWEARGNDYADKVTEDGWKLFDERAQLAKSILDDAGTLKEKCPQWYNSMQNVALAQNWNQAQAAKLFEQAIAFEPSYYYYYNQYANYLLPKWSGEQGETEQFADAISERIGGEDGSIIYFEIVAKVICHCNNDLLPHMSWAKIQKGYAALEKHYGMSSHFLNEFAYMAVKFKDGEVAQAAFQKIGNDWDKQTWRTNDYFARCKTWAAYAVEMAGIVKQAESRAEANFQTPEGREYDARFSKEFNDKYAREIQGCMQSVDGDHENFDILIEVNHDGAMGRRLSTHTTAVSQCILGRLDMMIFAAPPKQDYWVKINMNVGR